MSESNAQICKPVSDWRGVYKPNEKYILYWNWKYNLGDIFSNFVFDAIYDRDLLDKIPDRKKLLLVGSMLPKYCRPDVLVCGSGINVDEPLTIPDMVSISKNFQYVRGAISKRRILETMPGIDACLPIGDTGLIASLLHKGRCEQTDDIGIIVHWSMADRIKGLLDAIKRRFPSRKVEALCMGDESIGIVDLMNFISSKCLIISNSLHGLVFAHSFGINALCFCNWGVKFSDYYSVWDRIHYEDLSIGCPFSKTIDHVGDKHFINDVNPSRSEVEQVQKNIILSLPYRECFSEIGKSLLELAENRRT